MAEFLVVLVTAFTVLFYKSGKMGSNREVRRLFKVNQYEFWLHYDKTDEQWRLTKMDFI